VLYYSRDRCSEHPEAHLATYQGILQVDAYSGYNDLFRPNRNPGRLISGFCWAHARRMFFELADIAAAARSKAKDGSAKDISPIAFEAVRRMDEIFAIERDLAGKTAEERLAARRERSAALVASLEVWMRGQRALLSKHADPAKAIDYMLKRWDGFTRFLDDGRICLSNNAAERALRGIAIGRKAWLFCGSDRGGQRAAVMYSLIATARMNNVDPQAWLADVLARIASHPARHLDDLLPWCWRKETAPTQLAA
jgi:hypothetical protein